MTAISAQQFEALRTYLDDDCRAHLHTHGKWRLDPGKLTAALETANIIVRDVAREKEGDFLLRATQYELLCATLRRLGRAPATATPEATAAALLGAYTAAERELVANFLERFPEEGDLLPDADGGLRYVPSVGDTLRAAADAIRRGDHDAKA